MTPTGLRSALTIAGAVLLLAVSACGSTEAGKPEATESAAPTSSAAPTGAPAAAICKDLDLAPMTAALGGPAKVTFDLVKGDKAPYGGPEVAAPSCELGGGGRSLGFEVLPKVKTATDVQKDLKLNRDGAATIGMACTSTVQATAGAMKGGVHTCKAKNGYTAFMDILVDGWSLRCVAFKVDSPDHALKIATDACGAMLTHLTG